MSTAKALCPFAHCLVSELLPHVAALLHSHLHTDISAPGNCKQQHQALESFEKERKERSANFTTGASTAARMTMSVTR